MSTQKNKDTSSNEEETRTDTPDGFSDTESVSSEDEISEKVKVATSDSYTIDKSLNPIKEKEEGKKVNPIPISRPTLPPLISPGVSVITHSEAYVQHIKDNIKSVTEEERQRMIRSIERIEKMRGKKITSGSVSKIFEKLSLGVTY